jgi:hypothetical protein
MKQFVVKVGWSDCRVKWPVRWGGPLARCEARRIGLLDGTILLCDSGAFNRFILSRDLDHGSYSDLTLEEQRRLRLSCASHALKVRRAVASWHGLAPITIVPSPPQMVYL